MKQKGLSSIESPFCMAETQTALIFLLIEMIGSKG